MTPTIRYSRKGKTIETVKKISGFQWLGRGERDELVEHRRFLGQCNYYI